jgi:aromatic ring hydroxylase
MADSNTMLPVWRNFSLAPFAEAVYIDMIGAVTCGEPRVTFVGIRKMAVRHKNPFIAPLSSHFDELDAQMWLDNVFISRDRVFFTEPQPGTGGLPPIEPRRGQTITSWLLSHQLYCWLAKAECTLGLVLACTNAMGLREDPQTHVALWNTN